MTPVREDQLKWLTLFRVILITVLLLSTFVFHLQEDRSGTRVYAYLYYLCTTFYVLSFIYTVAMRVLTTARGLWILTYAQLTGDILMAAGIVLVTGGTHSVFTFFFSLVIIAGAIILFRPGAFFLASVSTVVMVTMGLIETDVLPYLDVLRNYQVGSLSDSSTVAVGTAMEMAYPSIYNVSLNMFAFYGVAFLASTLSEQVRLSSAEAIQQTQRLEELQALHIHIINSLQTGLATVDLNRRITYFNEAAEHITRFEREDVIGEDLTGFFRDLRFVLANPYKAESVTHEESVVVINRRRIYLAWSLSALRDASNQLIGHTFLFQDVTRTKEMERMMKRHENMAALGQMASAVAHEIRNPLAAISGSIQMLSANVPMDEDDQKLLRIVLRETDQLNNWINDFLAYSKLTPTQPQPLDLNIIVSEQLELFNQDETAANVEIDAQFNDDTLFVLGDAAGLRQIVWNLLKNASEAMPDGGTVTLKLFRNKDVGDPMAQLLVSDQGCGIPLEVQDTIFRPFFTTKERGTGLGLAIVHRIVENHDGRITLESEEGSGTTLRVELPLTLTGTEITSEQVKENKEENEPNSAG